MVQGFHSNDRQLNQLAQEAKQYPARSYERRRVLTCLIEGIKQSGRLSHHPYRGPFPYPSSMYKEFYNDALNTTFLEICQRIDKYDPDRDVMAWCNFLLKKRFLDILPDPQPGSSGNNELEPLPQILPGPSDSEKLRHLIVDENPGNMFTEECIQGNPKANFKFLATARIWEDRTWEDISKELKIPVSSLCEFYQKKLRQFIPYFREYLTE
jgi:hypothetical protein